MPERRVADPDRSWVALGLFLGPQRPRLDGNDRASKCCQEVTVPRRARHPVASRAWGSGIGPKKFNKYFLANGTAPFSKKSVDFLKNKVCERSEQ